MSNQRFTTIVPLTIIMTIGLILRLLFFSLYLQHNPLIVSFDSAHYHSLAQSLESGNGYVDKQNKPYFYRLPGYSFFLASCYYLFKNSAVAALWSQVILSILIPLFIFFLTRILFPSYPKAHLFATLLASLHPGYLIYSGLMMSETLFIILFILFTIMFFKIVQHPTQIDALLCGLILGLTSLVRPVGHLLLPLILGLLMLSPLTSKQKISSSLILTCTWGFTISWWLIRNYHFTGMIFFHTLGGPHFLNHCAAKLLMKQQNCSYNEAQNIAYHEVNQQITQQENIFNRPLLEIEETRIMEQYTKKLMLTSKSETIKLFLLNWFKTLCGLYSSELLVIESGGRLPSYNQETTLTQKLYRFINPETQTSIRFFIYYEILFFLLMIIGFCIGFYELITHNFFLASFIFIMITSIIFLSLGCGFARLRLPVEHFFIMLTSVFLAKIFSKKG